MGYVSWGTRRALGRRYSVDPALQFESERLQNELALAPGREARALQERQFNRSLKQEKRAANQAALGGMVGTVGNLGLTYAMGKQAGWWGGTTPATVTTGMSTPVLGEGATLTSPFTVNPALVGGAETVGTTAGNPGSNIGTLRNSRTGRLARSSRRVRRR